MNSLPYEIAEAADVVERASLSGDVHAHAVGADWQDPDPLRSAPPPLPLDLSAMCPPGLEWYADYCRAVAASLECDASWPAMLGLAVASMAACGAVEIEPRPGYREPPPLWIMALAPPSQRKSPVFCEILRPLRAWESERVQAMRESVELHRRLRKMLEARAAAVEKSATAAKPKLSAMEAANELRGIQAELNEMGETPELRPLVVSDPTAEALADAMRYNAGCVGLMDDEGASISNLLGRYSGSECVEIANKGYSGTRLAIARIGRGMTCIERPLLAMALAVQPAVLRDLLSHKGAVQRGLLARFLVVCPPWRSAGAWDAPEIPAHLQQQWDSAIRAIIDMPHPGRWAARGDDLVPDAGEVAVVHLAPEAEELAREFYESHVPAEDDATHGWAGKARGSVFRIALAIHLLGTGRNNVSSVGTIQAATLRAAVSLHQYLCSHFMSACVEAAAPPEVEVAERLLANLRRRPPSNDPTQITIIRQRDLFYRVRTKSVPNMETFAPVIELLADRGWIRQVPESDGPRGRGHPEGRRWEIHPSLLQGEGAARR